MARLIDADALYAVLEEMSHEPDYQHPDEDWGCGVAMAQGAVEEAPTIEAAPVVHGRWDDECRCTVCGRYGEDWYKRDAYHFDYCPNCGARMDGDGNV